MLLKELCEQHNIDINKIPQDILNIDLENKFYKDYDKIETKEKEIIITGQTGGTVTNTLIIKMLNDNDNINPNDLTVAQAKKLISTPYLTGIVTHNNWEYQITYNRFGGEISRT